MTQEEYIDLLSKNPTVELVRPHWNESAYHADLWKQKDITVLICQRKTKEITRLCIDSLLRFYPDIPILVVDGNSEDESTLYLKFKSVLYPNIKVWNRIGRNSHGDTMDEAIRKHIPTKYVLLMDSDIITVRGGYIEGMLDQFKSNGKLYATGSLMLVTRKNHACGAPDDINDVLRYAHPSCSIYHVPTYKELQPFLDHGAPCCYNMIDAEKQGLEVAYYPVDKYVAHLSGASWCVPQTIWSNDYGTFVTPPITFIITKPIHFETLNSQSIKEFEIITKANHSIKDVVIHGSEPVSISNYFFGNRFNVNGEYVCLLNEDIGEIDKDFVFTSMIEIINNNAPNKLNLGGLQLIKRNIWQRENALL